MGRLLKGGEVIELISDLGGGKTAFVRGLAKGMGSVDQVSSPTFTISKVYTSPHLTLHHYDFYRLSEAGMVGNELDEQQDDPTRVVAVEWAEPVHALLPTDRARITLARDADDEQKRKITIDLPTSLAYLKEGF